ncbi:MAG: CocE/NonD family hydrolase [Tractidigestivibacter sp.]|jgi:predicted acyl esterase|uniref:CocE/NonD family hydrolase n=1 Tax=Tractidigestivibacter sp. TaxID=2847320 RepID=UPI003D8EF151
MKPYRAFKGIPTYDDEDPRWIVKTEHWEGEDIDVIYRKGNGTMSKEQMAEARKQGKFVPPFVYSAPCDTHTYECMPGILCDRDTPVKLRDGVTIYADIYRPKDSGPVPLIISWGPFGKNMLEVGGFKAMGVPPQAVSKFAKFESADPAYWVPNGYAVANVDPRGVGHSEGYVSIWGVQDHYDGYDFIEWAAKQPWCTGKISMFGNSGVCMVIWGIASTQPPHLTCIAGWEGTGDMYRESFALGGIDNPNYNEIMINTVACNTYVEDVPNMYAAHPFYDKYWQMRTPKWENIKIPAYICSGMCHIHNRGSFEAFRKIRSPKKWMRAHREMEWPDTYNPENVADLKKFYDRYLKDIHNGWEFTPKVRIDVMDAYDFDFRPKRPENEFPLKRTQYKKIYLDAATHSGSFEPFPTHSEVVYDPKTEMTTFDITFDEDTEITGYISAHLNIECRGYDNMDLFLWVKKLGQNGEYVPISCIDTPYRGAWGYLRGRRRALDPELSTDFQPVLAHQKDEPMEQGKIYPVDIEFYPHSRIWHKGETLRLEIEGRFIKTDWFEDDHNNPEEDNGDGMHVIHTGGEYQSWLQVPVIPPKYVSGDYVIR